MSRRALTFICQNRGAVSGRWQGKCDACGEWNTIAEESGDTRSPPAPASRYSGPSKRFNSLSSALRR
jgi:DNA repair protein RadA/Sms